MEGLASSAVYTQGQSAQLGRCRAARIYNDDDGAATMIATQTWGRVCGDLRD